MAELRRVSGEFHHPDEGNPRRLLEAWLDEISPALYPSMKSLRGHAFGVALGGITITTADAATGREWGWVIVVVDWSDVVEKRGDDHRGWWPTHRRWTLLHNAAARASARLDIVISPPRTGGCDRRSNRVLTETLDDAAWYETYVGPQPEWGEP